MKTEPITKLENKTKQRQKTGFSGIQRYEEGGARGWGN